MRLFNEDRHIFGQYALILKKYCTNRQIDKDPDSPEWKVGNGEDSAKPVVLFDAVVDCLYAGASLALARGIKKKELPTIDKKEHVNILASAWKNRYSDFVYLYRLMILTDPDLGLSKDERVRKAFMEVPDANTEHEFNFFLQYAYAGLEELDKMLSDVKTYTDFSNLACKVVLDFNGGDDEEEEG